MKRIIAAVAAFAVMASSVPAFAAHAALVWSRSTGAVAWSYGAQNRRTATRMAINACTADDCRPIMQVERSCAAVSRSSDGAWAWSSGENADWAIYNATNSCNATSGSKDCWLVAWVCSG